MLGVPEALGGGLECDGRAESRDEVGKWDGFCLEVCEVCLRWMDGELGLQVAELVGR